MRNLIRRLLYGGLVSLVLISSRCASKHVSGNKIREEQTTSIVSSGKIASSLNVRNVVGEPVEEKCIIDRNIGGWDYQEIEDMKVEEECVRMAGYGDFLYNQEGELKVKA